MPHLVADFAFELASKLSSFLDDDKCAIVGHELQSSRLALVEVVGETLKATLWILGIDVVDRL
mgnify:CR=1 FL=1